MWRVRSSSLSGPGELVLEDHPLVVLRHRDQPEDPVLGLPVHHEAIDVEGWLVLLDVRLAGGEAGEVGGAHRVDLIGVLVGASREVDLGADDVEERVPAALRQLAGLLGVDDVVGDGGDFFGVARGRAEGPERKDGGHTGRCDGGTCSLKGTAPAPSPGRGGFAGASRERPPGGLRSGGAFRIMGLRSQERDTAGWRSGISSGS
jgi:hypothetical protein